MNLGVNSNIDRKVTGLFSLVSTYLVHVLETCVTKETISKKLTFQKSSFVLLNICASVEPMSILEKCQLLR